MRRFRIEYVARAYATVYVEAEGVDEAIELSPSVDTLTFKVDEFSIENEVIEEVPAEGGKE